MGNQAAKQSDTVIIAAPTYHTENFVVSVATLCVLAAVAITSVGYFLFKKCKKQMVRELQKSADIA